MSVSVSVCPPDLSTDTVRVSLPAGRKNNFFKNSELARAGAWHGAWFAQDRGHQQLLEETSMNTRISSKLAALAVAIMMNGLIIGGVAYLFSGQVRPAAAQEAA